MANSEFTQKIVELLLSWMRLVTGWVWNFFQADMAGGFLAWFADNWMRIALALIIGGLIVDWLIWMIRWRPYWLWLRKRQIIYEEVETRGRRKRRPRPEPARPMSRPQPEPAARPESEFDDPFAADEVDPYAGATADEDEPDAEPFDWDAAEDPYAAARAEEDARPRAKQKTQGQQPRRAASGARGN